MTVGLETLAVGATSPIIKNVLGDIYKFCKSNLKRELRALKYQKTLDEIVRQLRALNQIRTILQPEIDVNLKDIYYPARLVDYQLPSGSRQGTAVGSLREVPSTNLIIEGTIGQGKTCFLKHLALGEITPAVAPENARVPIFVELRNVEKSLADLLTRVLAGFASGLAFDDLKIIGRSKRIVLLLDAFDEVAPNLQPKVATEIGELAKQVPELQLVITTRPGTPLSTCPGFRTMKLEELRSTDHKFFLAKVLRNPEVADRIITEIRNSGVQVSNLLTTPLLLTLLGLLYRAEHRIPPTIHEFYQHLFDILFYRHDRMKEGFERKRQTSLSESDFKNLFEAVCFESRLQGLGTFDKDALRECIKRAQEVRSIEVDADKFREDCVKSLCLLQEEGLKYHFIHRSVQEYYAAAFVKNSEDEFAKRWYKALAAGRCLRFSQELSFLEEIDRGRLARFLWVPMFEAVCKATTKIDVRLDRTGSIATLLDSFVVTLIEHIEGKDRKVLRPVILLPTAGDEKARDFQWAALGPLIQRNLPAKSLSAADRKVEGAKFTLEIKSTAKGDEPIEVPAIGLKKYIEVSFDSRRAEVQLSRLVDLIAQKYETMIAAIAAEKKKVGMLTALRKRTSRALVPA